MDLITELDSRPWLYPPATAPQGKLLLVHLKIMALCLTGDREQETLGALLLDEERKRFSEFQLQKRRTEWLGGRLAAKQAVNRLAQQAGESDDPGFRNWLIRIDDQGRPFVQRADNNKNGLPDISISHSADLAAALAVDQGYCGLDLQKITAKILRVEEKFCLPGEYAQLAEIIGNPDRARNLTLLWAAKEAIRKANASQPLPGFLEVIMTGGERTGDHFRLEFTRPHNPPPQALVVIGGYYENFALAVCLLPDSLS